MSDTRPTAVLLNPRDRVVTAARELGLSVVVVADPELPPPGDIPGPVLRSPWTSDLDQLVERLRALGLPAPVSCFGFGELGSAASAVVNERLGWPGNPPAALDAFKDKAVLRAKVGDRAGVPVAHITCAAEAELRPAIERIGYPCVVKPVDGTGSSGVQFLADPDETERYLAALNFGTPHIVEEFLSGAEYSVEAVSTPGTPGTHGGHRILAITEKATTGAPHFVETGHTLPVRLDAADEASVHDLVTGTLDAVGYRYGPSHTEVMLTKDGPRLIESHGRPGGDRISDLLFLALGEDVFAQAMTAVLGLPEPPPAARRRMAGIRFVTFDHAVPVPGISTGLVTSLPGVAEAAITVEPGRRPPEVRQSGDRHGFVVATGDTRDELDTNLARAVRTLTAR